MSPDGVPEADYQTRDDLPLAATSQPPFLTSSQDLSKGPFSEDILGTLCLPEGRILWLARMHGSCNPTERRSRFITQPHIVSAASYPSAYLSGSTRTIHRYTAEATTHLSKFREAKELVQVVADAFEAHSHLYSKCNTLHKDVNDNTILIHAATGRGVLVDWDQVKEENETGQPTSSGKQVEEDVSRLYRTGAWYFMSGGLLDDHYHGAHSLQDDFESFFHVLLYYSLKFLKNNQTEDQIEEIWREIFEESRYDCSRGRYTGGWGKKLMFLQHWKFKNPLVLTDNEALERWFCKAWAAFYQYSDWRVNAARAKAYTRSDRFRDLFREPVPFDSLALHDHGYLRELFMTTLAKDSWSQKRKDASAARDSQPYLSKISHNREDSDDEDAPARKRSKTAAF